MTVASFVRSTFVTVSLALALDACHRHRSAHSPAAPSSLVPAGSGRLDAVRIFERHREMLRDSVARIALALVGTPYEFGGATPHGFDCSGLVQYVLGRVYLEPPRTASEQSRIGTAIARDGVRPGDVLAFGAGDSVTHVGIYVGDRKFVHASSVARRVIISRVDRPPSELIRPLKGARRVLLAIADPVGRVESY